MAYRIAFRAICACAVVTAASSATCAVNQAGSPVEQVSSQSGDLYHEYGTVTPGGGAHLPGEPEGRSFLDPGPVGRDRAVGQRRGGFGGYGGLGNTVVGPGGVIPMQPALRSRPRQSPVRGPTVQERQAAIRKALAPRPPLAAVKRETLDTLYAKLARATDEDEAKGYAALIAAIWARSGSDTASLLMARADEAAAKNNYSTALAVLDQLIVLQPTWTEAWNKRASVRYRAGDLSGAMSDVEQTLKLDPKHFSALAGMAMILLRNGADKQALRAYRRDLTVYPLQPDLQKIVDALSLKVEGQGI